MRGPESPFLYDDQKVSVEKDRKKRDKRDAGTLWRGTSPWTFPQEGCLRVLEGEKKQRELRKWEKEAKLKEGWGYTRL